jgi:hypothetical protein
MWEKAGYVLAPMGPTINGIVASYWAHVERSEDPTNPPEEWDGEDDLGIQSVSPGQCGQFHFRSRGFPRIDDDDSPAAFGGSSDPQPLPAASRFTDRRLVDAMQLLMH